MKKKIFGGTAIVAIAVALALNVSVNNHNSNNDSILALANVEALADENTMEVDPGPVDNGSGGIGSGAYCHYDCYHNPAICWRNEWTSHQMDVYCVRTGNPSNKCYAYKCW